MARWQRYDSIRAGSPVLPAAGAGGADPEGVAPSGPGFETFAPPPAGSGDSLSGVAGWRGRVVDAVATLLICAALGAAVPPPVTMGASVADFRDPAHGRPLLMQLRAATVVSRGGTPVAPVVAPPAGR